MAPVAKTPPELAGDGTFVIYFPHDAHMPGLALEKPAGVVKVVVKVLVDQGSRD
jgi:beta-galactosidase beta subunit